MKTKNKIMKDKVIRINENRIIEERGKLCCSITENIFFVMLTSEHDENLYRR